jgi:hypothetical protein
MHKKQSNPLALYIVPAILLLIVTPILFFSCSAGVNIGEANKVLNSFSLEWDGPHTGTCRSDEMYGVTIMALDQNSAIFTAWTGTVKIIPTNANVEVNPDVVEIVKNGFVHADLCFTTVDFTDDTTSIKLHNENLDMTTTLPFEINVDMIMGILVSSPNGGEAFSPDMDCDISWSCSEFVGTVTIDAVYDGGSYEIDSNATNDGSYTWHIPSDFDERNDYTIKITMNSDPTEYDESNSTFTISTISVDSPGTGDVFAINGNEDITWSTLFSSGTVKLELYRGASMIDTIAGSVSAAGGSYSWDIPGALTGSTVYKIKITLNENTAISDTGSDFTILSSISATGPSGGSVFNIDDSCNITWTSINAGNVKIELYKNGVFDKTVSASTANDGSHSWNISTNYFAGGVDYTFKISTLTTPTLSDDTDAFTIDRWIDYGYVSVGATSANQIVSYTSIPYVAFRDENDANDRLLVRYYSSGNWYDRRDGYATPGAFSAVSQMFRDGYYYRFFIAFADDADSKLAKAYWDYFASGWAQIPGYISSAETTLVDMAWGGAKDVYYAAYQSKDGATYYPLKLTKFSSTAWGEIGDISSSGTQNLAIVEDPTDHLPIILFKDYDDTSDRLHVKKYVSGTGGSIVWTNMGYPSSTNTPSTKPVGMAIGSDGKPVVFFYSSAYTFYVKKWSSGTTWTTLYSDTGGWDIKEASIAIGPDDKPVLAYKKTLIDPLSHYPLYVLKHDSGTTWNDYGMPYDGTVSSIDVAVDPDNNPIVIYSDYESNPQNRCRVKLYK